MEVQEIITVLKGIVYFYNQTPKVDVVDAQDIEAIEKAIDYLRELL